MSNDTNLPPSEHDAKRVGFGMVRKEVFRDPALSAHAKLVYVCLATYAGAGRRAFPSRETIARDTGLSVRAVGRAVKEAEALGLIEITHTQTSNRYVIHDYTDTPYQPEGQSVLLGGPDSPSEKDHGAHEQDQTSTPESETSSSRSSSPSRRHSDERRTQKDRVKARREVRRAWEMPSDRSWLDHGNLLLSENIVEWVEDKYGHGEEVRNMVEAMCEREDNPIAVLNAALKQGRESIGFVNDAQHHLAAAMLSRLDPVIEPLWDRWTERSAS